ncbi:MAG TPA: permease [Anaeromyxobacteraceae bacterium]|nr:permease [Anaeromyxobacteraceae bacterium]
MNRVAYAYRRARQQLRHLRGHFELDGRGNRVTRRTDFSRCQNPVLLLYGVFATRRTLDVLERRLRRDGYCVFSLDLSAPGRVFDTRGIPELAELVRAKVERMYARYPGMGPLSIVGHSKGGLIGAYYVKRLGGDRRTRALVTLGTPHNGTKSTWVALPMAVLDRSILQMLPGSSFVRRLQAGPWPPGVRLTSIYSTYDRLTVHPAAVLDPRGNPLVHNVQANASHRGFLVRKGVYDAVLHELRLAQAGAVPAHASVSEAVP